MNLRRALLTGAAATLAMTSLPAVASATTTGDVLCTYVVVSDGGLNFRDTYATSGRLVRHLNKGERFDAYRDRWVDRAPYRWRLIEKHPEWPWSYGVYAATGDESGAYMARDPRYSCYDEG
ncbi:hypothetical protein SAMN05421504_104605 [Amycolatopsis xylanica]|uniref:Uncharacterized protein n=1 Tax=Amycolatopsis xylanica TaxID=589385 RepID=A0A1H3HCT8_9PSEU|nr:hypothetical protein [Amycolatopsis xylanica]SDY13045.1 hypothetical protein SAMN05421504_104605 [Amycolatopsis xylanica]